MGIIPLLRHVRCWILLLLLTFSVSACTDSQDVSASDAPSTHVQGVESTADDDRPTSAPQELHLQIFPRRVNFGRISANHPVTREIVLRDVSPMDGISPTILDHPSSISASIVSSHEHDEGITLVIQLSPIDTIGRVRGQLAIAYGSSSGSVEIYAVAAQDPGGPDHNGGSQ